MFHMHKNIFPQNISMNSIYNWLQSHTQENSDALATMDGDEFQLFYAMHNKLFTGLSKISQMYYFQ